MTRVTQLIHDAGKYLLISVYPLPTHPTHNFTHNNGGNLETLPGWPKKLQHKRAQVNNDLSWIRANGIHAKALSEENLKIPIRKWKFKVHFENHIQMPQGAMS